MLPKPVMPKPGMDNHRAAKVAVLKKKRAPKAPPVPVAEVPDTDGDGY